VRVSSEPLGSRLERAAPWCAALTALSALAVAFRWGTSVVGGSDSNCYVSQAGLWLKGTLFAPQPIGFTPPWPNAALSLAPTGFIPSPVVPGAIAPMCPPGLALTMASAWALAGPSAVFAVVPLLGALVVWLTFLLGRTLDRPATGLAAAVLVTTSPIVLFQIVQPMSDVPVTAWWLLALVLASRSGLVRALGAGLAASAAILTRPNLAPLALVIAAFLALRPRQSSDAGRRIASVGAFLFGVLPGAVMLAWIQRRLYGSPLGSGYGPPGLLFSWSHLLPNLQRYPAWLLTTHTPVVCLAVVAPFVLRARARHQGDSDEDRKSVV
jgi:4-amino-4-deoxy-L-arabinose transferase-like glycosyltransferase